MGILEFTELSCSGIISEYSEKQKETLISSQRLLGAFVPTYSQSYGDNSEKHLVKRCYKAADITKVDNNNQYDYNIKHTLDPAEEAIHCGAVEILVCRDENYSQPPRQKLEPLFENCENDKNSQANVSGIRLTESIVDNSNNRQQKSTDKIQSINILQDTIIGYHEPCLEIFEDTEIEKNEKYKVHSSVQVTYEEDEEVENKPPRSIGDSGKLNEKVQLIKNGNFKNSFDLRKLRCSSCKVGFQLENCPCSYFTIVPSPLKDSFVAEDLEESNSDH